MGDSTLALTPFGWPVVIYLTLAGVVSGLALWSAVDLLRGDSDRRRSALRGLGLAALGIAVGGVALVMDLEAPKRFWLVLVHFNPGSVIAWGARIIALFGLLSAYTWWIVKARGRRPITGGAWLASLGVALLAIGVALYPGLVLFQATARPLWTTPWVAPLFVLSALHAGLAMLLLLGGADRNRLRGLAKVELVLVLAQAGLLAAWLVTGSAYGPAVERVLVGELAVWLWLGVVALGWVVPLALARRGGGAVVLRAFAVVLGTFALRAVVVFGGQGASALISTLTQSQ